MDKYVRQEIDRELASWSGVTGYEVVQGKKHLKIVFKTPKSSRFITTALTPSDRRATKNIITTMRRVLRELGAEKE